MREKGVIGISGSFETQSAMPLDARSIVPTKAELYLDATWTANDGNRYAYKGLSVTVHSDPIPANNGTYYLNALPYTVPTNWTQLGSGGDGTASVTPYAQNTAYVVGQIISINNREYVCTAAHTSPIGIDIQNSLLLDEVNWTSKGSVTIALPLTTYIKGDVLVDIATNSSYIVNTSLTTQSDPSLDMQGLGDISALIGNNEQQVISNITTGEVKATSGCLFVYIVDIPTDSVITVDSSKYVSGAIITLYNEMSLIPLVVNASGVIGFIMLDNSYQTTFTLESKQRRMFISQGGNFLEILNTSSTQAPILWEKGYPVSDWYLPSNDELVYIGYNDYISFGLTADIYWSSTEDIGGLSAFAVNMSDASSSPYTKDSAYKICLVRSFISSKTFNLPILTGYSAIYSNLDNGDGTYTYFEVSTSDIITPYAWSSNTIEIGTTSPALGAGAQNTIDIVANLVANSESGRAAQIAQSYTILPYLTPTGSKTVGLDKIVGGNLTTSEVIYQTTDNDGDIGYGHKFIGGVKGSTELLKLPNEGGAIFGSTQMGVQGRYLFDSSIDNAAPVLGPELLSDAGWTSTGWTGSWSTGWVHKTANVLPLTAPFVPTISAIYVISYSVEGRVGYFNLTFGSYSSDTIQEDSRVFGPKALTASGLVITPSSTSSRGTLYLSIKQIISQSTPIMVVDTNNERPLEVRTTGGVFIGLNSGRYISSIDYTANTAVGKDSSSNLTTGVLNTALGENSLRLASTAVRNTAIGASAISTLVDGTNNVAVGYNAAGASIRGNNNTAIGTSAGSSLQLALDTGNNTLVGYNAGAGITTGTGNTIIGANIAALSSTLTDSVIIANGSGAKRIYIDSSGKWGIGTVFPRNTLSVTTLVFSSANSGQTAWCGIGTTAVLLYGGTTFTDSIVGSRLIWNNGTDGGIITAWVDATHFTITNPAPYAINMMYEITTTGLEQSAAGNVGIKIDTPTARLHLPAGTAAASTAPLKINPGVLMTTPEDGAIERDGSNFYYTIAGIRYQFGQGTTRLLNWAASTVYSANEVVIHPVSLGIYRVVAPYTSSTNIATDIGNASLAELSGDSIDATARTVYVTSTGNDTTGTGLIGAPFLTIKRAYQDIKSIVANTITIQLGSGTFNIDRSDFDYIQNIKFQRNFTLDTYGGLDIKGTLTEITPTGFTVSIDSTTFVYTVAAVAWTVDAYKGMLLGNGTAYFPIESNTSNTLTVSGNAAMAGSWKIYNQSSIITTTNMTDNICPVFNNVNSTVYSAEVNTCYSYRYSYVTINNTGIIISLTQSMGNFLGCTINGGAQITSLGYMGFAIFVRCYLRTTSSAVANYYSNEDSNKMFYNCVLYCTAATGKCFSMIGRTYLTRSIISNFETAFRFTAGRTITFNTSVLDNLVKNTTNAFLVDHQGSISSGWTSSTVALRFLNVTNLLHCLYEPTGLYLQLLSTTGVTNLYNNASIVKNRYIRPDLNYFLILPDTYPEQQDTISTCLPNAATTIPIGKFLNNKTITLFYTATRGLLEVDGKIIIKLTNGVSSISEHIQYQNIGVGCIITSTYDANYANLVITSDLSNANSTIVKLRFERVMV